MILSFDDFQIDTERYELRHGGRARAVEPKVFDLIAYLAQHPERVFSRDELVEEVWRGRIVSDATISTCVKNARKALGDSGRQQRYIKTVRGRGVRFTAEVTRQDAETPPGSNAAAARTPAPGGIGPSLLLVPLRSVPDAADVQALAVAESLTSDLATILTRVPLLRVRARLTGAHSQHAPPSPQEQHAPRGVDFVLEGTTRTVGDDFLVHLQLLDARAGFSFWAERVRIPGPVSHALEHGVEPLIAKLEPRLNEAIYDAVRAAPGPLSAEALYLEAYGILTLKGWHHQSFVDAAELLRRARALDPEFALAAASLALVMGFGHRVGLSVDRDAAMAEAVDAAERALELDGRDSTVLGLAGCALADVGQLERAVPILRNAVELDPANAQAWAALGAARLAQGHAEDAVVHLAHGVRISPLDARLSIWGALLALAHLKAGDSEHAFEQAELACQRDHRAYIPRVVLAVVCVARGDADGAAKAMTAARQIKPDLDRGQIDALAGHKLGGALARLAGPTAPPVG